MTKIDQVPRRKWLPDNVTSFKDRCGRVRYRFRKKGSPTYLFRCEPGTPGFMEELAKAKSAVPAVQERFAHGSFDALIESYYRSKTWVQLKNTTQRMRVNMLERFRKKHGHKPVISLEPRHIDSWMSDMALATPHAANHLRKLINQLMKHAILLGWRKDNPVAAIDSIRVNSEGYHCWTEDEIEQFDAKWALGTRERLAKELLLYTGLRRSNMVTLGRQNRKGDVFYLHHTKNRSDTVITILPPLAAALNAIADDNMTYLVTLSGKPFTSAGFGNWFRERCDMAGLPHCTAHGLRKSMARRLAEAGANVLQGRAVLGHHSDAMFAHYAAAANRKTLSDAAMNQLAEHMGMANDPVSLPMSEVK